MTFITIRQAHRHFTASFVGHSGDSAVCTAISSLSYALYQGMIDADARGEIAKINRLACDDRTNSISVDLVSTEAGFPRVLGAFSVIASGCALIASQFPDSCRLGRKFQEYVR